MGAPLCCLTGEALGSSVEMTVLLYEKRRWQQQRLGNSRSPSGMTTKKDKCNCNCKKGNATAKAKCVAGMMALAVASGLPGFGVLPARVSGVIEVEQEAFAAVEEAEAEEIVSEEGESGADYHVVKEGEAGAAGVSFVDDGLRAEGAVAVEAFDVALYGGVGVVDDVMLESFGDAVQGNGLVNGAVGEAGGRSEVGGVAAEEAEVRVGVEASVANPATEEEIAAAEEVGVGGGLTGEYGADLDLELGGEGFVGVEGEDPGSGALLDREIFLTGEALPGFEEEFGFVRGGDLEGAVGGAGVDDDDLVGELDAREGAGQIGLFVERNDGYGQLRCHDGYLILPATGAES